MMTPFLDWDIGHDTAVLPSGQVNIRQTFPTSGCYDAGTLEPIWQVNWYALPKDLRYSSDFSHIARRNRFAFTRSPAIWFYHDGKLARQYSLDQLLVALRNRRLFNFTSGDWHFTWYDPRKFELDGDELRLSTDTRVFYLYGYGFNLGWHEDYRFNLVTGEMTDRHMGGIGRALTMLVALPLAFLLVMAETCRRSIRYVRGRLRNTVGFPVSPML